MQTSERIALAAHLHVVLRRKTGRVTDVEWMAVNAEYAAEVVRYARERAAEDGIAELVDWADKLERAMATPLSTPRRPLLQAVAPAFAGTPAASAAPVVAPEAGSPPAPDADSRYVGGLR
jgi:hypothetical protein